MKFLAKNNNQTVVRLMIYQVFIIVKCLFECFLRGYTKVIKADNGGKYFVEVLRKWLVFVKIIVLNRIEIRGC